MARLYGWLAGFVAILAIIGAIYGKATIDANHRNEVSQLTETIELVQKQLDTEQSARQTDTLLATENAKRQAALQTKIGELTDYVDTLQDRDVQCLTGADTERLRDLWR